MNKIREMFKANVVSLKIRRLVIKESVAFSPMLEHAGPCPSMQAQARACWPMPEHAGPCPSMLAYARACWPMLEHAGPCPSMLAHVRACSPMPEHARPCPRSGSYCNNIHRRWGRNL